MNCTGIPLLHARCSLDMKDLPNPTSSRDLERLCTIQSQNMSQSKEEPLIIEFDAITEDPLMIPKSEQIKEEPEESSSTSSCAEPSRSPQTNGPAKFQNERSSASHRKVPQDQLETKTMMKPGDKPPSLESGNIMEIEEVNIKMEQPEIIIEDSLPNHLDTRPTVSLSIQPTRSARAQNVTKHSTLTTLFPKSFNAISDDEARRMVAKYFVNPSKKIRWQTFKKISVECSDESESDQQDEIAGECRTGDEDSDINTSENDILYWRRTQAVQKTHNLQALYWSDYVSHEDFPDSRESVASWCNEAIENLTCGKKAVCGMNLDPDSVDISAIDLDDKALSHPTISKSDALNKMNPSSITKPSKFISTTGAHPIIYNKKNKYSDIVYCLLWGRKKIWILLRPENEWKLHSKLHLMLGRSRTRPWKPGLVFPSHPRELIVTPSQLDCWKIPYEIVVQYPGDLFYPGGRIVLCTLDAGPNIGATIGVGGDFKGRVANSIALGRGPGVLNMIHLIDEIRIKSEFYECERPWCHAMFHLEEISLKHAAAHRRNEELACELCNRSFENLSILNRHMQYVHAPELKKVFCPKCSKLYKEDHFPFHKLICKGPRVCVCGRTDFRSGAGFVAHQRGCHVIKLSKIPATSVTNSQKSVTEMSEELPSKRPRLGPDKPLVSSVSSSKVCTIMAVTVPHPQLYASTSTSLATKSFQRSKKNSAQPAVLRVERTASKPIEFIDLADDETGKE